MKRPKTKRTQVPRKPDDTAAMLEKMEIETHKKFHSKSKVKRKKKQAGSVLEIPEGLPGLRPPDKDCKTKKALVVIGCLTGNSFADAAFRNTAAEAVSDLTDRGYKTTLLSQPTNGQVQAFIADPCVKAFVYVGHGSDEDSGDSRVGGPNGGDFIWPNCDEVITSAEIRRWMNGGSMDVVILHACFQGSANTRRRWQSAFGVGASNFHSWSGICRYFTAFWWQFGWS